MAAFACAVAFGADAWSCDEGTRARVVAALRERSPGSLRTLEVPGVCAWLVGGDGVLEQRGETLLVSDGRPQLLSAAAAAVRSSTLDAAAWQALGTDVLPHLDGSFAFAALDATARRVTLARDRFGARPLFWVEQGGVLYAASECKALAALGVAPRLCRDVLDEVLVCRSVQGERAFLAPYRQVPPATAVTRQGTTPAVATRYWRMAFAPEPGGPEAMPHYVEETRRALRQAIAATAAGRGEVGVLLSGGVDSSAIAAVAREAVDRVIAFIGRLPDAPNPELERAQTVAKHLGIECRVVDVRTPDLRSALRAHVRRFEEPPRHPNNLVLQQLFERARQDVAVVLQGDGAEMTFGLADVKRVAMFRRKHEIVRHLPRTLRDAAARVLRHVADERAMRLAAVLSRDTLDYAARLDTVSYTPRVRRALRHLALERPSYLPFGYFEEYADFSDALQAYQMYTFTTVSLVRHDRMAQPAGIVCESPFLRDAVLDVALRLPRALRHVGMSKPVLRGVCDLYLPHDVARRPKLGFDVPWDDWVSRAVAGGLDSTTFLQRVLPPGYLDAALASNDAEALWTVLTLQALAEEFALSA